MARRVLASNVTLTALQPGMASDYRPFVLADGKPLKLPAPSATPSAERFEVLSAGLMNVQYGPGPAPWPQAPLATTSGVAAMCLTPPYGDGDLVFGRFSSSGVAIPGLIVVWTTAPEGGA
jgi:hypothetical protein